MINIYGVYINKNEKLDCLIDKSYINLSLHGS